MWPAIFMGAGLGALGGLLSGRDPLKGALLGGATSGLLNAIPAGAFNLSTGAIPSVGSTMSSVAPDAGVGAFVDNAAISSGIATDPITGEVLASTSPNVGVGAFTKDPSMYDYLSEQVSPYMNVRDLSGAAQVASQFQPRQQQMQAPSGQVTQGRAPQGTDVMALLQSIKQPDRRRITLL